MLCEGQAVSLRSQDDQRTLWALVIEPKAWTLFAEEEVDVDAMTQTLCYGDVVWEMTHVNAYKHFKVVLLTEYNDV